MCWELFERCCRELGVDSCPEKLGGPGTRILYVVVVYHVTIVAIGYGLPKKFWFVVIGYVLRTALSSLILTM